jgi:hypothetical protein
MSLSGIQTFTVYNSTVNIVGSNQINTSECLDRRLTTAVSWPVFSPQALLGNAEASGRDIHVPLLAYLTSYFVQMAGLHVLRSDMWVNPTLVVSSRPMSSQRASIDGTPQVMLCPEWLP